MDLLLKGYQNYKKFVNKQIDELKKDIFKLILYENHDFGWIKEYKNEDHDNKMVKNEQKNSDSDKNKTKNKQKNGIIAHDSNKLD